MNLTPQQLHVLQHALGADQYGRPRGSAEYYRNHFCGESPECEALCAAGLMVRYSGHPELTAGDPIYRVTDDGKRAMIEASPKPPKLTRSQERYRRYLAADGCGLTFREWLAAERTVAP